MSEKKSLTILSVDKRRRCWWPAEHQDYLHYHDNEWGLVVHDDFRLFEKICLEGFQAGLSWLTILRKRDRFREVFLDFNFEEITRFKERDVKRLLGDSGIVRHRGKIESTINNAARAIELREEFNSLSNYFWSFAPKKSKVMRSYSDVLAVTPESTALSKDLKKRGWSFVGPTTSYAFMQSMGVVNDHARTCFCWEKCEKKRQAFMKKL